VAILPMRHCLQGSVEELHDIAQSRQLFAQPCSDALERLGREVMTEVLGQAGVERFLFKAKQFEEELATKEAGQVLYRAVMRALGYAKNTKSFEELADRIPLNIIETQEGLSPKQALLLGAAGLLPSQRWPGTFAAEKEIRELDQLWESVGKEIKIMRGGDWNFSHVYPNSYPVRRIVALSYLIERYYEETLLAGVLQLVKEASLHTGHRVLENGLTVAGDGYWQNHFDFNIRSKTTISALLGNSKAAEILVNVVLPFAFSWGKMTNEAKLAENAIKLYRGYPKLAEHCITRHMAKQLVLEELSNFSACHQQGLIHIFSNYCREGRCSQCSLVS